LRVVIKANNDWRDVGCPQVAMHRNGHHSRCPKCISLYIFNISGPVMHHGIEFQHNLSMHCFDDSTILPPVLEAPNKWLPWRLPLMKAPNELPVLIVG